MKFPAIFLDEEKNKDVHVTGVVDRHHGAWKAYMVIVWRDAENITSQLTEEEFARAKEQLIRDYCNKDLSNDGF